MLDRRWFSNDGPLTQELEQKLAEYLGVEHCVLTCNATTGLQLAVRALEIEGEVIVPSFTFVSAAHALRWLGVEPVFCDIDPDTWNIDPGACESLITARTGAILGVHLWGRPCDTGELGRIAKRHGIPLLYDAAHAFGCEHDGLLLGCFGNAEVFSFHATKAFHTFEGGAVTTNDDRLARRLRLMRNFGFTGYDQVALAGVNAKMPEASAAMGLANFEALDEIFEQNRVSHQAYCDGLRGIPGLRILEYNTARHNRHYVVLEVDPEARLCRDYLVQVLHAENVLARRYFYPGCHRMEPYASQFPECDERLPNTNRIANRSLVLPAGAGMEPEQISEVCDILRTALSGASAVRAQLEHGDAGR